MRWLRRHAHYIQSLISHFLAGNHGVVQIPNENCPTSFTNNPSVVVLAPESNGGTYVWTASKAGTVWVACQVRTSKSFFLKCICLLY